VGTTGTGDGGLMEMEKGGRVEENGSEEEGDYANRFTSRDNR